MTSQEKLIDQGRLSVDRLLRERGADDVQTVEARCMLARALTLNHEVTEAREILEDVLKRQMVMFDSGDDRVLRTELWLAAALIDQGDLLHAKDLLRHVVVAGGVNRSDDQWPLNPALVDLARTLCSLGKYDEELPIRERVLASYTANLGADDAHVLEAKRDLAVARRAVGDFQGAYDIDRALLGVVERSNNVAQFLAIKFHLAIDLFWMGREEEGLRLANEAYLEMKTELPPENPVRKRTEEHLKFDHGAWILDT
jgi:tetratricopeptide (TPR) repeat protein